MNGDEMDAAPLSRDGYTPQVIADLYKQLRVTTMKHRRRKGQKFLDYKLAEEAKPRTDTVVREMVNADEELYKLQNAKMYSEHQVLIMRAVLGQPGLATGDGDGEDDEE